MPGTSNSGGQNRKTPEQHRLEGTFQRVRHGNIAGPTVPKGRPEPPKPLEGDARDEWDRMVTDLEEMGSLSRVDSHALYQYCQLFAETEHIAVTQLETAATIDLLEDNLRGPEEQRESLLQVVQEIGKLKALESRYTNQVRQGRMAMRQYLVEFGMTPSARGRVKIPTEAPPADPFDEFDRGPVQ